MARLHPICEELKRCGIRFAVTIPDQWLAPLDTALRNDPAITLVPVAREEEGVGICAGLYFGNQKSALIIQNAGLLAATNSLNGVAVELQIPMLILVSYRGSIGDTYRYQFPKGKATEPLLRALDIPYYMLKKPDEVGTIAKAQEFAYACSTPVAVLLGKEALEQR